MMNEMGANASIFLFLFLMKKLAKKWNFGIIIKEYNRQAGIAQQVEQLTRNQ